MTPTAPSPEGLRYDYEHSLLSIAKLEAKYRLSRGEIADFRVAEKWTARESTIAAANAYRLAAAVSRLEFKSVSPFAPSPPVGEGRGGGAPTDRGGGPSETKTSPSHEPPTTKPKRKPAAPLTGGNPKHRKSLIMRLYDLFDTKVGEIEERAATRARLTRPENESEVRVFGQLIKYFESLTDLSDAELKAAQTSAATDITHDDAERLRQNLVERLEKLRPPADPKPSDPIVPE